MRLKFNKEIYQERALKKTAREFACVADISITSQGDYYIVEFNAEEKAGFLKEISSEFANYAIFAAKGNR